MRRGNFCYTFAHHRYSFKTQDSSMKLVLDVFTTFKNTLIYCCKEQLLVQNTTSYSISPSSKTASNYT